MLGQDGIECFDKIGSIQPGCDGSQIHGSDLGRVGYDAGHLSDDGIGKPGGPGTGIPRLRILHLVPKDLRGADVIFRGVYHGGGCATRREGSSNSGRHGAVPASRVKRDRRQRGDDIRTPLQAVPQSAPILFPARVQESNMFNFFDLEATGCGNVQRVPVAV